MKMIKNAFDWIREKFDSCPNKSLFELEEDYKYDLSLYLNKKDFDQLVGEIDGEVLFPKQGRQWMKITDKGEIDVFKGYAWDGNSPKFNSFDLFWLGTPDGLIVNNKPITYYASLIHDILGQYKREKDMPSMFKTETLFDGWFSRGRLGRDALYFSVLKSKHFMWRCVYYFAVALFGPLYDLYLYLVKSVEFDRKDSGD